MATETDGARGPADPGSGASLPTADRIEQALHGLDDGTDPFVAAVRSTRMPMIVTDPRQVDNPVVYANDAFCWMTGYERREILGRNCRFLQSPETDARTVARIRAAVAATQPIEIDIRNRRKNGEPFWNRLLMAPVFDAAGRLAYFIASQVDVSVERERLAGLETDNAALMAELTGRLHAQQEREREMAFAMRAGRFGTWSLEFATMELTASETCKELFGRAPGQPFTYQDRLAAILPEDRDLAKAAMTRTREQRADYHVTYRVRRLDGAVRWLTSSCQVFADGDGRPLRMAGVSRDVTS